MSLTATHTRKLKALLEAEREELVQSFSLIDKRSKPVALDQSRVGRLSRMDALQGQALAQAGELRQKQRLTEIDGSLTRLEQADYGRCAECDQWIVLERLMLDPAVECCVTCAAKQER